jgi:hypothetical protein
MSTGDYYQMNDYHKKPPHLRYIVTGVLAPVPRPYMVLQNKKIKI